MPRVAIVVVGLVVVGGVAAWALRPSGATSDDDAGVSVDPDGGSESSAGSAGASSAAASGGSAIASLPAPARLLDTRAGQTTVDGQFAGAGAIDAGATFELPVAARVTGAAETGLVSLTVTSTAAAERSDLVVQPCGGDDTGAPSLSVESESTVTRNLVVPVGPDGSICLSPSASVDVVVDLDAFVDQGAVRPFPSPVAIVDSTPRGDTADGKLAGHGVRPEQSTLRVPVAVRFDGLGDVGAVMLSLTTVDPLEPGDATVFAPEAATPTEPTLVYEPGTTARSTAIVPLGPSGELCVSTTGRTDVVVELLGLVPSSSSPTIDATGDCPDQAMFPARRVVALYGTQRSARLGVLGEQDPAAAADRLADIAEPWRDGDRPVLPAFELIATLATGTPEDRGVYNLRAAPEFVQEYLDVARRHGYHLILDLQAGQSDFLTEAKYYEEFLRQPDVGLALDPEWRTEPPARPRGGFIGTVDAAEVNEVVEYVAQLVAEEGLPEKLLVLHQFEPNMITNRDQIVELPGVAIVLHMDGFGPRPEKLNSYDIVRAGPPWNMGLKLFYDEDTDLLEASDVLGGLFDPIPDVVTYQ